MSLWLCVCRDKSDRERERVRKVSMNQGQLCFYQFKIRIEHYVGVSVDTVAVTTNKSMYRQRIVQIRLVHCDPESGALHMWPRTHLHSHKEKNVATCVPDLLWNMVLWSDLKTHSLGVCSDLCLTLTIIVCINCCLWAENKVVWWSYSRTSQRGSCCRFWGVPIVLIWTWFAYSQLAVSQPWWQMFLYLIVVVTPMSI